jgi:hypothetical protein
VVFSSKFNHGWHLECSVKISAKTDDEAHRGDNAGRTLVNRVFALIMTGRPLAMRAVIVAS